MQAGTVRIAGVRLTDSERVVYAPQQVTKRDLALYYQDIGPWILPHVTGRPLTLVRCPKGSDQDCFFQKHAGKDAFPFVNRIEIQERNKVGAYLEVFDVPGLISLVQMGVLELHTWGALLNDIEKPDRMIFDLDPAPDVPHSRVVETAQKLRARLREYRLTAYLKTTGGKGYHLVVPLDRQRVWERVKRLSREIAESLVLDSPEHYTISASRAQRPGKVFIDYLRNTRGATAVAPYSTRARPGAPVATPISWEELEDGVRSDQFTIANVRQRLERLKRNPWEGFPGDRRTKG